MKIKTGFQQNDIFHTVNILLKGKGCLKTKRQNIASKKRWEDVQCHLNSKLINIRLITKKTY